MKDACRMNLVDDSMSGQVVDLGYLEDGEIGMSRVLSKLNSFSTLEIFQGGTICLINQSV